VKPASYGANGGIIAVTIIMLKYASKYVTQKIDFF